MNDDKWKDGESDL